MTWILALTIVTLILTLATQQRSIWLLHKRVAWLERRPMTLPVTNVSGVDEAIAAMMKHDHERRLAEMNQRIIDELMRDQGFEDDDEAVKH